MKQLQANVMVDTDWYQRSVREFVGWWCMWSLFSIVLGLGIGGVIHDVEIHDVERPNMTDEIVVMDR